MRITDLEVDGFGVWSGMKLDDLSERLTVFYGPNEAGKTTLMQFIRAVFYGFAADRRRRYLPPAGGLAGGAIHVSDGGGEFVVSRYATPEQPGASDLTIAGPDGKTDAPRQLELLLGEVDESIFNNIFAVGLREIQELGALGDTEAARWLYRLTSGLDRVSLVDVMHELESSRNQILAAGDRPSQVTQLLAEHQRLSEEIQQLSGMTRHWVRLRVEHRELDSDVAQLEAENVRLDGAARAIESALAVRERWQERAAVEAELASLEPRVEIPEGALERLDKLNRRLARRRHRRRVLRRERRQLREEADQLAVNEILWRQAPRIEALGEQLTWITTIESQVQRLEADVLELETQWKAHRDRLGLGVGENRSEPPELSGHAIALLRGLARVQREAKQRVLSADEEARRAADDAAALDAEIKSALAARSETDLPAALEKAGQRASQLRRCMQLDERLDQLQRNRDELQWQNLESVDRQLMPVWVVAGLGGLFVLGVVLIVAQLLLPMSYLGPFGWSLAVLGIFGAGAAGLAKLLYQRSAASNVEAARQRMELLSRQLDEVGSEREALGKELPPGGGPLTIRLQTAEKELAALEVLLPLDARWATAAGAAATAETRRDRCREEFSKARDAWRRALAGLGLPANLSPKQVRELAGGSVQLAELRRRLDHRREELTQRRQECAAIAERVARLVTETGLTPDDASTAGQIRQLLAVVGQEEARAARRDDLRRQAQSRKQMEVRYARSMARLQRRGRAILRAAGAQSESQYRQLALQQARGTLLERQREGLNREIAAALEGRASHEEVATYLAGENADGLEPLWETYGTKLESNREELKRLVEQRGQLGEQQRRLAEDRRLADRRLELAAVQQRLRDSLGRWRVRAVTHWLLESIRKEFEEHRQPETLVEASDYLGRLTEGHYRRIWTPLGEDVLYVDDDQGKTWPVDVLSRGTREQLFLCLRLALVAHYARRGVQLPLVLDDVLVNFDAVRAKAAAALLRDFAKAGHQLLVFTCHEHVWKMFKTMKADARRLPVGGQAADVSDRDPRAAVAATASPSDEDEVEEFEEEEVEDEYLEEDDYEYEEEDESEEEDEPEDEPADEEADEVEDEDEYWEDDEAEAA